MLEVAAGARENRATTGVVLERSKACPSTLCPFFFLHQPGCFFVCPFFFRPFFFLSTLFFSPFSKN